MRGAGLLVLGLFPIIAGCGGNRWEFHYDAALRQARRGDRDVLVFYKDPMDASSGRMCDILESPEVAKYVKDKVRCMLVPFYRPNRGFLAQYGVSEVPAIVVVHPDNTYHALSGVHNTDRVIEFLKSANAPGAAPTVDPRVPRLGSFEYFNILERAQDKAKRQNRRLLIIYKWWLDPKSTELIQRVSRPHVARYFKDTVNCILDWDHLANRRKVAQYGVTGYPSMIMVEPSGEYRVLRGLRSVEEIIRFAISRAPRGSQQSPGP